MPNIQVKIENLAEIQSAFKKSPTLMTKYLNEAIRKTALRIQEKSMINAPVDTGRLRASHQTMFENLKATVTPNVDYAIYVHKGTYKMEARPFLLEAVESENDTVNGYFKKAVQDTLDDIARSAK